MSGGRRETQARIPQVAEDQGSQEGEGHVDSVYLGSKDNGLRGQEGKFPINLARVSVVIVIIMKHLKAHAPPGLARPR